MKDFLSLLRYLSLCKPSRFVITYLGRYSHEQLSNLSMQHRSAISKCILLPSPFPFTFPLTPPVASRSDLPLTTYRLDLLPPHYSNLEKLPLSPSPSPHPNPRHTTADKVERDARSYSTSSKRPLGESAIRHLKWSPCAYDLTSPAGITQLALLIKSHFEEEYGMNDSETPTSFDRFIPKN